ncbi:hypothetical protein ACFLQX_03235 [Bacteroidota bacterium]
MDPIVEYSTISNSKVLIRTFKSLGTMNHIIDSWQYVIDHKILEENQIGVISDFRDADLQVNMTDLELLKNYYNSHSELFGKIKVAQVVDSPKIVYPILYELKNSKYNSKPFSKLEATIDWVQEKE